MFEKITAAIDQKLFAIGIFIDLSKAFDTVNHQTLLNQLEYYGIRGIALKWFADYLTVANVSSSWQRINCGDPKDQYLGLYYFLFI